MQKYTCKKEFFIAEYDEDGFPNSDEKTIKIKVNSIWEKQNYNSGISDVHLTNADTMQWLEVSFQTFNTHFQKI